MFDVLVVGGGPAGLSIAAALSSAGLDALGITPADPATPWTNTFGSWCDDLEQIGLDHLLGHRWSDCMVYTDRRKIPLGRAYGLFDNRRLQEHLLQQAARGRLTWERDSAAAVEHFPTYSRVITRSGTAHSARLVVDASGHFPALLRRQKQPQIAYQAAFGVLGRFSAPPIQSGRMVLMDYRTDHLPPDERSGPATFLYAMEMGNGQYFVEETSLAAAPPVPLPFLERRLHLRLAHMGVEVREIDHIERCLFPMNLPLPARPQRVLGYGGAASMVHPATGYQVGAALKHAPAVARAVAGALSRRGGSPARAGWQALWPRDRVRKHYLYLFGLENLMRFDQSRIQAFFEAFFDLPLGHWAGYLSDSLTTPQLIAAMTTLFRQAPLAVRWALVRSVTYRGNLLWDAIRA